MHQAAKLLQDTDLVVNDIVAEGYEITVIYRNLEKIWYHHQYCNVANMTHI